MARLGAEICIVGGGIMGLWAAWEASKAGLKVTLIEAAHPGAGASGGTIGALAPHLPDRWNPKKQFQLEALKALPQAIAEVEALSGLSAGYARFGRVQPILNEAALSRAQDHVEDAKIRWGDHAQMQVLPADAMPDWIDPAASPFGLSHDTLTGRLNPRLLCEALAAAITMRGVNILTARAIGVEGRVVATDQGDVQADAVIVSAGVHSFDLLSPYYPPEIGRGEKGQSLSLALKAPAQLPVIYAKGTYVIGHADGTVAVGATSERAYTSATQTDAQLDAVLDKARSFCPAIRDAKVLRRWAGVRPRAAGRDPLVGAVAGQEGLFALTGGFKISFGVGQKLAQHLVAHIQGARLDVPETFQPPAHLAVLKRG